MADPRHAAGAQAPMPSSQEELNEKFKKLQTAGSKLATQSDQIHRLYDKNLRDAERKQHVDEYRYEDTHNLLFKAAWEFKFLEELKSLPRGIESKEMAGAEKRLSDRLNTFLKTQSEAWVRGEVFNVDIWKKELHEMKQALRAEIEKVAPGVDENHRNQYFNKKIAELEKIYLEEANKELERLNRSFASKHYVLYTAQKAQELERVATPNWRKVGEPPEVTEALRLEPGMGRKLEDGLYENGTQYKFIVKDGTISPIPTPFGTDFAVVYSQIMEKVATGLGCTGVEIEVKDPKMANLENIKKLMEMAEFKGLTVRIGDNARLGLLATYGHDKASALFKLEGDINAGIRRRENAEVAKGRGEKAYNAIHLLAENIESKVADYKQLYADRKTAEAGPVVSPHTTVDEVKAEAAKEFKNAYQAKYEGAVFAAGLTDVARDAALLAEAKSLQDELSSLEEARDLLERQAVGLAHDIHVDPSNPHLTQQQSNLKELQAKVSEAAEALRMREEVLRHNTADGPDRTASEAELKKVDEALKRVEEDLKAGSALQKRVQLAQVPLSEAIEKRNKEIVAKREEAKVSAPSPESKSPGVTRS